MKIKSKHTVPATTIQVVVQKHQFKRHNHYINFSGKNFSYYLTGKS